jgi:hypothetical protein
VIVGGQWGSRGAGRQVSCIRLIGCLVELARERRSKEELWVGRHAHCLTSLARPVDCGHEVVTMAKLKTVGVREFRDHATTYLSGSDPVAVSKHGRVVGFSITPPARRG